jgi:saccharopine dehydrogenase (NAD+, L-lysine-forming)
MAWLIYGANGYTGQLIAEAAGSERPVLAGRSEGPVRALAERLGFEWRAFDLARPQLDGIDLVLHCAGPFSATSRPMVDACLERRAHYLDITGEHEVIGSVLGREGEARAAGVTLLPAVGFDVVPSDCLAALLHRKLPGAVRLELAFAPHGRSSRGTLKTAIENLPRGNLMRRGGKLVDAGVRLRSVPFPSGERRGMAISWGDLASAWRSTGIPDITVYVAANPRLVRAARARRFFGPVFGLPAVQRYLKSRIDQRAPGPGAAERIRGSVELWGRVEDAEGKSAEATLVVPEGYSFTATAALACVKRVREGGVRPGAFTPSQAFGPDFVRSLPGVELRM